MYCFPKVKDREKDNNNRTKLVTCRFGIRHAH
jgi:hypothetical protein